METLKAISLRRTVRNFRLKPISEAILIKILEAGRQAPRAGNLSTSRFIVVIDKEAKKNVATSAAKQMWLADASALIVICSLTNIIKRNFDKGGENYSIQNSTLAAENMLIAATGLNVGSAFVSAFSEKLMRKYLKIPDDVDVHAIVALGYPQRMPKPPARMSMGEITYLDRWKKPGDVYVPETPALAKLLKIK